MSVTVPSKHNKHPERNFFSGQQKNSLQLVLTALCAVCLTGRKAGLAGCRLLRDSVQTFGPSPDGPRSEQLQKVCGPQPVRHPQEPVHQRHAGKGQLKHPCLIKLGNFHKIIQMKRNFERFDLIYWISCVPVKIDNKVQSLHFYKMMSCQCIGIPTTTTKSHLREPEDISNAQRCQNWTLPWSMCLMFYFAD